MCWGVGTRGVVALLARDCCKYSPPLLLLPSASGAAFGPPYILSIKSCVYNNSGIWRNKPVIIVVSSDTTNNSGITIIIHTTDNRERESGEKWLWGGEFIVLFRDPLCLLLRHPDPRAYVTEHRHLQHLQHLQHLHVLRQVLDLLEVGL
jgi:hypothetical protein